MTSQISDEMPFEAKFQMFKEEILAYGIQLDSLMNLPKLFEILDSRIADKQFGRDMVVSIHNHTEKDIHQNFTFSQFLDGCIRFRRTILGKVETAQFQLSKLQNERVDTAKALSKAQEKEQDSIMADKRNGVLTIEVNGLQSLNIPNTHSVFVRFSCYNSYSQTSPKQYTDQVFWEDKFSFTLLTGFERIDAIVIASSPMGEEVVGTVHIHASSITSQAYTNEWVNLYDGKSLMPVGTIKLGVQLVPSKAESRYLQKITEKLDGNISLQIQEIEELERTLKIFNALLMGQRNSYRQSVGKKNPGLISPHQRLTTEISHRGTTNDQFRTILEEESCETSLTDIASNINGNYNYNASPTPSGKNDILSELHEASPTHGRMSEKGSESPKKALVYKQGSGIMAKNPFATKSHKVEAYGLPNYSKDSGAGNSSVDTQSSSGELSKNINEGSDKDAIINYLQKKLNEVVRDNDHLSNFVADLTMENERLKLENAKLDEFKAQAQDYEDKIGMLFTEIQRLDQIASQKQQEQGPLSVRGLGNPLNSVHFNQEIEKNMMLLIEENKKLTQLLTKQSQETNFWKQQAQALKIGLSPVQSPRLDPTVRNSITKKPLGMVILEGEAKRARESAKIFADDRNLGPKRVINFNSTCPNLGL